ncbi:MAG: hypothetical protein ACLFQ5_10415 [Oceanicaulis sp.]
MSRYWFARRRADRAGESALIGNFRPVSWEGWACIAVFGALVLVGALLWAESAAQGLPRGWLGFAFPTIIGAGILFIAVGAKGDPDHTAADYKAGRVKNNGNGTENA